MVIGSCLQQMSLLALELLLLARNRCVKAGLSYSRSLEVRSERTRRAGSRPVPAIDRRIVQKSFTSTPLNTTEAIKSLSRDLAPAHRPMFVKVASEHDAAQGECFYNVGAKVARSGGEILYGWAIWEWPNVFVEAEHHAVWNNGDELLDVTPPLGGEHRVLFLPDPARAYDFESRKRLPNVTRSLGLIPAAQHWLDATHQLQDFMDSNSNGRLVIFDEREFRPLIERVERRKAEILVTLAERTRVSDPCFCGSGRRYRKCCGPMIDLRG
jgi:hypothetical protein